MPSPAAIMAMADAERRLAVHATPNASADAILLPPADAARALLVRTTATPEKGRANEAILALVAKALGRPRSALSLLSGDTSRDKIIRIGNE